MENHAYFFVFNGAASVFLSASIKILNKKITQNLNDIHILLQRR